MRGAVFLLCEPMAFLAVFLASAGKLGFAFDAEAHGRCHVKLSLFEFKCLFLYGYAWNGEFGIGLQLGCAETFNAVTPMQINPVL